MKNLIFFILCLALFIFMCVYDDNKTIEAEKQNKSAQTQVNFANLEGIDYSIKDLSDSEVEYLKQSSPYKDLYGDKKLVIYFVGANCPYAKEFTEAIEPLTGRSEYSSKYNFYPDDEAEGFVRYNTMEEAQAAVDFSNACQSFCVVNPDKKQIFAIDGVEDKEAQKIGLILDELKEW